MMIGFTLELLHWQEKYTLDQGQVLSYYLIFMDQKNKSD
jgi:hypothetical protein